MEKQKYCGSGETGKYGIWIICTTTIGLEHSERLDRRKREKAVRGKGSFPCLPRLRWLKEH